MSETLRLLLSWAAGLVLGAVFFGGLWWTLRRGLTSQRPAIWFLGSMLLRTGIALSGFYFVAGAQWERLLPCLLGFFTARLLATWLTRRSEKAPTGPAREARHAS